jgi:hypothetical protein
MSRDFYKGLKNFSQFSKLASAGCYTPAPEDWYVVSMDIENSTKAVSEGKYKEVNLVSAAAIMAILNKSNGISLPYVFGGDGATILIPVELVLPVNDVMAAVKSKIKTAFDLELRVGIISLKVLYREGAWLKVAKFKLSSAVSQAVFQGTALSLAEQWLKGKSRYVTYCRTDTANDPDFKGLECRWQPIENRNGQILSLLVKAQSTDEERILRLYNDVLRDIDECYPDLGRACPTSVDRMRLSLSPKVLGKETSIRGGKYAITRFFYLIKILLIDVIGKYCLAHGKKMGSFDGSQYLSQLVANSDFRKCDEMLRMVLDSTPEQQEALEEKLRQRMERGEIIYGMHASSRALMTCLVFSHDGNHVHFIDGADGGYTLASKQMKQQAAKLNEK